MAASGRKTGRLPEPPFAIQIGDTLHCLESCVNHGFQRFSLSFNRTAVIFITTQQPARASCDLGTFSNCFAIGSSGSTTNTPVSDTPGYALIPGVLHAYKVSAADLGAYIAPVPEPETYAMLLAGLGLVGFMARRRNALCG